MADTVDARVVALTGNLEHGSRRVRQEVAHDIAELAASEPERLMDHIPSLVDALYRPEAQTRWEILKALTSLVHLDSRKVGSAFEAAENSLFDDTSAPVRLASFLFLVELGCATKRQAEKVWPLLDEAIQCYHGDAEYRDMLQGLQKFVRADLSKKVKEALADRCAFDAENSRGFIKTYSQDIVAVARGEKK